MKTALFTKDPHAIMDYSVDWSDWLNSTDTINSSTWITASGITASSSSVDSSNKITTVRLQGGTANGQYRVTNRITTTAGLQTDRSIYIMVEER